MFLTTAGSDCDLMLMPATDKTTPDDDDCPAEHAADMAAEDFDGTVGSRSDGVDCFRTRTAAGVPRCA